MSINELQGMLMELQDAFSHSNQPFEKADLVRSEVNICAHMDNRFDEIVGLLEEQNKSITEQQAVEVSNASEDGISELFVHASTGVGVAFVYSCIMVSYIYIIVSSLEFVTPIEKNMNGSDIRVNASSVIMAPELKVENWEGVIYFPFNFFCFVILLPLHSFMKRGDLDLLVKEMFFLGVPVFVLSILVMGAAWLSAHSYFYGFLDVGAEWTFFIIFSVAKKRVHHAHNLSNKMNAVVSAGRSTVQPTLIEGRRRLSVTEAVVYTLEDFADPVVGAQPVDHNTHTPRTRHMPRKKHLKAVGIGVYFTSLFAIYAYPLVLIPAHRAGDGGFKLFVVLVLHPCVMEGCMTFLRNSRKTAGDIFNSQGICFFVEAMLGLIRRFFITNMGTVDLTRIAIVLTSLQEIGIRASMMLRHRITRKLLGHPPLTEIELNTMRRIWAVQINVSALVEIESTLVAAFAVIMLAPSASVVNIGYTKIEQYSITGVVDQYSVIESAIMQIAAEVLVDTLSFKIESLQGIPVIGWYYQKLAQSSVMIVIQLLSFAMAFHWTLYCYKTVPLAVFCDRDEGDPCQCDAGHGYELWQKYFCAEPL